MPGAPTTAGPVRSRSQVMQMPMGDSTMPFEQALVGGAPVALEQYRAASACALARQRARGAWCRSDAPPEEVQGCMKPPMGMVRGGEDAAQTSSHGRGQKLCPRTSPA